MPFDAAHALAQRAAAFEEAAILRMAQRARNRRAAGHDVVSLTVGEPDFDTPPHIREAAAKAMADGFTHYAPVAGFPDLREAIAEKLKSENGLAHGPGDVVVSNGAKQSITNAAFATLDPGDEAILVAPFWAAYQGIVEMAGGTALVLPTRVEQSFKLQPDALAAALTPRSKLLFLNAPANPTGTIYEPEELAALARIVAAHPRLLVISDEIYEYIAFDGRPRSFGTLPGMADRTITVNGFSKGFAMTGWRLGYAAAAAPIANAMMKIQGAFTAGANAFVQKAGVAALTGDRTAVMAMRDAYRRRRDLVTAELKRLAGVRFFPPPGSFYAFPDISARLPAMVGNQLIGDDVALCDWLLDAHDVAIVPGSAFGDPRCIRLSFALGDAALAEGLARLDRGFAQLQSIALDRDREPARDVGMKPFFVQIKCELGRAYEVAEAIADAEIASEIYSTAGGYDLLVKFYLEDGDDVGQFINQRIHAIPGVRDTYTIVTYRAF